MVAGPPWQLDQRGTVCYIKIYIHKNDFKAQPNHLLGSTTDRAGVPRPKCGVRNSILHATQSLLSQGVVMRDRRRGHCLATGCSRPATGAVLAHPVAATRHFTGIECAYDLIW